MRRVRRHLKSFARLYRAGWLTFYGKINVAFDHITKLYAGMCMPRDRGSFLNSRLHNDGRVTRHRAIYHQFSDESGQRLRLIADNSPTEAGQ